MIISFNVRPLEIRLVNHHLAKKMEAYRSRFAFRIERAFFLSVGKHQITRLNL